MGQEKTKFQIGDSVVVRDGVMDPDDETVDIGGWQGRILEISQEGEDEPVFLVQWDGPTLRGMPQSFVLESVKEDLDFTSMYLGQGDLAPATARDTKREVEAAQAEATGAALDQMIPPEAQEDILEYTQLREGLRNLCNDALDSVTREEMGRGAKELGILQEGKVFSFDSEEEMDVLTDFILYELKREGIPLILWHLRNVGPSMGERNRKKTIAAQLGSLFRKEDAPQIDIAQLDEAISQSFSSLFQIVDVTVEGLMLTDLLDPQRASYRLVDIGFMSTAQPEMLIFCRLLPFPRYHIASGASFCFAPGRQAKLVRSYQSAVKGKPAHRVPLERFRYFHRASRRMGLEVVYA